MEFFTRSGEETIALGKKLGSRLVPGDCVALSGPLGAGKTAFTKGIALALGIREPVTSPTFTVISEYEGTVPLYHIDAYRLQGPADFINLGAEDLLFGQGVCVIEWSERIREELPDDAIRVTIEPAGGEGRRITLENWPRRELTPV
ncbi:MAG: tRNA (adenosine(37)-N6)-threonylcarbamoyltransferase complex ATPase subunit type 1 TsaE [Spirochaetaceae bacterium]|jgi:tRNA threonylcarbamoyladenosine biosynthesis protein TsaE|nr:tRNA (adenosine(37)-N6)-threonylcarbamoyltransferase complex ATPase subunit type 1 TsaE [Spirochaetaceae bacterium]